jgi:hypothetical protein
LKGGTLQSIRAQTVRNYLVEAGVSPEIITTKGYGKSNPLVEGKTGEARAKKRRVEIAIVDTILDFNQLQNSSQSPRPQTLSNRTTTVASARTRGNHDSPLFHK